MTVEWEVLVIADPREPDCYKPVTAGALQVTCRGQQEECGQVPS